MKGTIAGHRCPRCQNTDLHGMRRTFGSRIVEEFFCPACGLLEVADSDQPNYVEMLTRWRPEAAR